MIDWPNVEDARRRIDMQIDGRVADNVAIAAADLIVLMRELGRVTAALAAEPDSDTLYKFNVATEEEANRNLIPPPPLTQGEKQHLGSLEGCQNNQYVDWQRECATLRAENAALRQRADEATRAENEACAVTVETYYAGDIAKEIAKSIRARVAPKGEP